MLGSEEILNGAVINTYIYIIYPLGGGLKYVLFSPLFRKDSPILTNIFLDGLKPPTSPGWVI